MGCGARRSAGMRATDCGADSLAWDPSEARRRIIRQSFADCACRFARCGRSLDSVAPSASRERSALVRSHGWRPTVGSSGSGLSRWVDAGQRGRRSVVDCGLQNPRGGCGLRDPRSDLLSKHVVAGLVGGLSERWVGKLHGFLKDNGRSFDSLRSLRMTRLVEVDGSPVVWLRFIHRR